MSAFELHKVKKLTMTLLDKIALSPRLWVINTSPYLSHIWLDKG